MYLNKCAKIVCFFMIPVESGYKRHFVISGLNVYETLCYVMFMNVLKFVFVKFNMHEASPFSVISLIADEFCLLL